ncbi:Putative F-box-like domain superfamily protein [Septoria linicola]|uniref:F-box-like domain superfamily protein n=1 Tax=Septoria linicola TaxID=215465 RepID=A0A9Q9ENN0_9PEZI|nr:putative F-box-like domain superfamily protein [Septoria linicola]USW56774.1 Putative F-box-like domain superfamily protein [Septoria linicola]
MATAQHAVLNTAGLLEAILLQLDPETLLFSQRVNKKFKAVIGGSIHLKRALWFEPTPCHEQNPGTSRVKLFFRKRCGPREPFEVIYAGIQLGHRKSTPKQSGVVGFGRQFIRDGSWQRMVPLQPGNEEEQWVVDDGVAVYDSSYWDRATKNPDGFSRLKDFWRTLSLVGVRSKPMTMQAICDALRGSKSRSFEDVMHEIEQRLARWM